MEENLTLMSFGEIATPESPTDSTWGLTAISCGTMSMALGAT